MRNCKPHRPTHVQNPFVTRQGRYVEVDVGMYHILTELKRLGVDTEYSCEGGGWEDEDKQAYVLGSWKTFNPVLKRMRQMYRDGELTEDQAHTARMFLEGWQKWEIAHFSSGLIKRTRTLKWSTGSDWNLWSVERKISDQYGFRMTWRWPYGATPMVLDLFRAM